MCEVPGAWSGCEQELGFEDDPPEMLSISGRNVPESWSVIALSLSQLPGGRVSWGTSCWQLARTADNLELRFQVTGGPFGDKPGLLKPVAIFLPVFNTHLPFCIK